MNTKPLLDSQKDPTASRTLVVVDMQPRGFPLANVVLRPVRQVMAHAIANNWPVLVVEFDLECAGPTDSCLLEMLASYRNWQLVKKEAEDGSLECIRAAEGRGFGKECFAVVGVTTDDCISKTVHGLVEHLSNCRVGVVTGACTNWEGHRFDWSTFSKSQRIVLV